MCEAILHEGASIFIKTFDMRSILRITAGVAGVIGAIVYLLWNVVDLHRFEALASYLPSWLAATLGICGLFYMVWDIVGSWPRRGKSASVQEPPGI